MKTHFREAFQEIRDVEDSPVTETFDQANLVSDVLDGVQEIIWAQVAEALPHVSPAFNQMHPPPNGHIPQANMIEHQQMQTEYQPPPVEPSPYNHANMMTQLTQSQNQNQGFTAPPQQPPQFAPQAQQGFSNFDRGRGRGGRGRRGN